MLTNDVGNIRRKDGTHVDSVDTVGRKASPQYRRLQLILATISVVARGGLSQATLSNIAKEADVSHGLTIFHFAGKAHLLVDTLSYLVNERGRNLELAVDRAPPDPASRLHSLILAETLMICQSPEWISAWCALWSDPQCRGDFLARHGEGTLSYIATIEGCCQALIAESAYTIEAKRAARLLRMTIEGVWLESVTCSGSLPGDEAYKTVLGCAAVLFPRHFEVDGLGNQFMYGVPERIAANQVQAG